METPEQRIERVVCEEVAICPYDPGWPEAFQREKEHLESCLPADLLRCIEHFGSTAVPGRAAKPIVDMLVEVEDLRATRERIAPVLESQGYDYLWHPTSGDDGPPFYAWFIKRDPRTGARTHHVHMVEAHFAEHWDRLLFRDRLIEHPEVAREYERLKIRLASASPRDRVAYTRGKTEFIVRVTGLAKRKDQRMTQGSGTCPKCGGEMESGFLLDRATVSRGKPLLWVEAEQMGISTPAEPGDDGQIEVDAYRCGRCGHLELYAGMGDEAVG